MKRIFILCSFSFIFIAGCIGKKEPDKINLRLKWAYQAQFSGYLVAKEKGFYKDEGLDVNIQPAGPDLRPYSTVASTSDDIGIGIISQIITSRSNGVPLVVIAQLFQDSPNRFILKSENRIDSLQQLKNKKVGLWLGGDEIEFISMLKQAGMKMSDVKVIPQKFSVLPFIENEYVLGQVMLYNEIIQVQNKGYTGNKLQILSPKDYNSAILGDLLFTNETFLKKHPEQLQKFLAASFKGWKYVMDHPDESIDIVLKYNPELKKDEQLQQLKAIITLINSGDTQTKGIGYIPVEHYSNAKQILLNGMDSTTAEYKKIKQLDLKSVFTSTIWDKIKPEQKILK